ncbi:MAG: TIGR02206 family membrane protein [Epulopiscium sp.]|nr:TIGR02206 family membrane protein [Candidatus Epulonipiscium sp.]
MNIVIAMKTKKEGRNMKDFFGIQYQGEAFKAFSYAHISTILIILSVITLIYRFREKLREDRINQYIRYTMGTILLIQQSLLYLWYHANGLWSFAVSLPLNLCEAAVILCIVLLFTQSKWVYEVLYFWAMCGVLSAIITPDLGYNFPHFMFYHFFITHGLVVIAVLFMTFVNRYRPQRNSIGKVLIITNLYMIFVAFVNIFTGGNYLFLRQKPSAFSIMDYLGPWPWYILSLEGIALIGFILAYLPFRKEFRKHT